MHHQAAILAPNGKPVLHIVEQNPDFVQSIAVSIGGVRPLSPIDESATPHNNRIQNKVSVHPVPFTKTSRDYLGVAKIISKENRFVHSIRIGGSNPLQQDEPSRVINSSNYPPVVSTSAGGVVTRKPSVTFSERVELVASGSKNSNNNAITSTPYGRKPSAEQDSIVTESLLLMTSRPPTQDLNNAITNNNNSNRLINSSKSSDVLRKVSTGSSIVENVRDESQRNEDLEAFSSSIRKNRPVKHILSNSGKSLEISAAADHYSSNDFIEGVDEDLHIPRKNSNKNHHVSIEDVGSETDETRSSSTNNDECSSSNSGGNRRPRGVCPKSPFGGIADHYGMAKEIAKEIESYSNGDPNKTSSKKSLST